MTPARHWRPVSNLVLTVAGCTLLSAGVPAYATQVSVRASATIVDPTGISFEQRILSQDGLTLILSGTESDPLSVRVASDLNRIDRDTLYPVLERDFRSGSALGRYAVSVASAHFNQGAESRVSEEHVLIVAQYN